MFKIKKKSISPIFLLGILLLPYDAIRNSMPSNYRPISVYFFLFFAVLYTLKNHHKLYINNDIKRILLFYSFAITYGGLLSIWNTGSLFFALNEFFSLTLGMITFISTVWGVDKVKKQYNGDPEKTIVLVFKIIAYAYMIPTLIWFMDFAAINGLIPINVKFYIMEIFGGFQTKRMTGTTLEASWLSKHALFVVPVYYYLIREEKKKLLYIPLLISVLTFIFTFSLQGFGMLVFGLVFFSFLKGYVDSKLIKSITNFFVTSFFILVLGYLFYYLMNNILPPTYYTNRIKNFVSITHLMKNDGSFFVRIGMPLISMLIFKNNIFGTGLGTYSYYFPEYIDKYFSYALSFKEVQNYYINFSAPGGSALIRVFAEFGIIGALLFYNYILKIYIKVKRISTMKHRNVLLLWFALSLAYVSQEGYSSVQFWFTLGCLSAVTASMKTYKIAKQDNKMKIGSVEIE